jgi:hypothetical protein
VSQHVTSGQVTTVWASARITELLDGKPDTAPEYGSAAWIELPANDPRRAAALITAAECWRRYAEEQARLDQLAEDDPGAWFDEVTAPADEAARRFLREERAAGRSVSSRPTFAELKRRRQVRRALHIVRASPGWSPVAIPGRPGWWRHLVDGAQVDLPSREAPEQKEEAA